MAGTNGQTPDSLISELAKNPFAFDFFRAIRLLENSRPDLPRIGYSISPAQDPVRFGQKPSLVFPPSTLEALEQRPESPVPALFVHNFGLFGPNGPLPLHLSEYAFQREYNEHDRTFSAFANIFHHRLISFFYRAWADNQMALDMDRPENQRFRIFIGSLFGLGMEALQHHDSVQDRAKLFFAGRLACQTRNAEGLEAILRDYFEIKSEVIPFLGRWMNLPANCVCRIGRSHETGKLGVNVIVGARFFEAQLNFRIRLGPMKFGDYERMLPGGNAFQRLRFWVLNYCGEHFFWDVQLVLRADEVPSIQLGRAGKLGWTTWLKSFPFVQDADNLILNPAQN
jgi:type VI secretion system protein ImpH